MKFTAATFSGLVAVASAANFNSTMTSAPVASGTGAAKTDCESSYNACRTAYEANMSTCAAQYASCLGYNPFASNGTNTATGSDDVVYTTEVVTSFTTYCPAATTLTYNHKTYTVTEATTLTITDCPCTLTKASTSYPAPTASTNGTWYHNSTAGAVPNTKPYTTTGSATTTTAYLTAYTTYCPSATTLTIGSSTYTVSTPTTIVYSATTPFPVTQTKSAFTSVVTPSGVASGSGSKSASGTKGSSTASSTVAVYTGAASALTVGGSSILLAAVALLF